MEDYRYILEPYKGMNTRHRCPECGKNKTFTFYIDSQNNQPLSDRVGRCNREIECGFIYSPKQYFADNGITPDRSTFIPQPKAQPLLTSYIDKVVYRKSLTGYEHNNFVKFLHTLFDNETVAAVINQYQIGTSKHWEGAVTFWQIDLNESIRTGKVMLYGEFTGKRIKEPFNHIQWVHKALKLNTFILKQCLFGLPLIKENNKPVAIVESEKTAIISSVYLPQFTWLACGGIGNLNKEVCEPLNGKKVILYPDLNAFDKWNIKAKELGFSISDLLERKATTEEKTMGLDLADYLIKLDLSQFKKRNVIPIDVIELQKYYSNLELNGLIPDKHRNFIGQMWQGIQIYINKPLTLKLYTEPLKRLKIESLTN